MKKSIAFIGAMFMSVFAFAQVSKNENTNKTPSRKVMDADVKDQPAESEAKIDPEKITSKHIYKATVDQNTSKKENIFKVTSDKTLEKQTSSSDKTQEKQTIKMTEANIKKTSADPIYKVTSEKKSIDADNTTIKQTGTQSQTKSSDLYLKIGDIKGEK